MRLMFRSKSSINIVPTFSSYLYLASYTGPIMDWSTQERFLVDYVRIDPQNGSAYQSYRDVS